MKANVGGADKVIRVVVGLIIIVLGLVYKSWWGLVGVLILATGVLNFCLLYIPLGISTRKAAPQ
jgi:type IV secretory pathway TrbD component